MVSLAKKPNIELKYRFHVYGAEIRPGIPAIKAPGREGNPEHVYIIHYAEIPCKHVEDWQLDNQSFKIEIRNINIKERAEMNIPEIRTENTKQPMNEEEQKLFAIIEEYSFLFDDMLFRNGSKTYDMVMMADEDGIIYDEELLPDEINYFDYGWYTFKVKQLEDCYGYYDHINQTIAIDKDHINPNTVLHELIHLHESLLLSLEPYYRDVVFYELIKSLEEKIPNLRDAIETHGHLSVMLRGYGGLHSILFLLKSFEIDIYMGWDLGTTFGYGEEETYKEFSYQ